MRKKFSEMSKVKPKEWLFVVSVILKLMNNPQFELKMKVKEKVASLLLKEVVPIYI